MIGWILRLFRGRSVVIPQADKLAEGEGRKVDLGDPAAGGRQVLLCRVDGKVHALDTLCPHEGGRIAPGPLAQGRYAVCPLHGYRFDPKSGESVGVACRAARTYRVEERGGEIEVWV